jgi:hypothetical protein
MPDIFGASGQFAIDALGQQNQNALNNAYGSGGFGGTVGQYAPYPMFGGPIDTSWQPSSLFSTGAQPFYNPMSGGFGSTSYNPYSPSTYAPQTPSWFGGGGGGFGDFGGSDFNSRFGGSGGFGGGGGGSRSPWNTWNYAPQPASLSMNPWLSLGYQGPQQGSNIDPHLEFNPYNPNQPQGFGQYRTLDQNVINPDTRPNQFFNLNNNPGSRDAITMAMMSPRPQVALGTS